MKTKQSTKRTNEGKADERLERVFDDKIAHPQLDRSMSFQQDYFYQTGYQTALREAKQLLHRKGPRGKWQALAFKAGYARAMNEAIHEVIKK